MISFIIICTHILIENFKNKCKKNNLNYIVFKTNSIINKAQLFYKNIAKNIKKI
jgi:hypothetical protein